MTKTTKAILGAATLGLAIAGRAPAFGHRMGDGQACGGMMLDAGSVLHALDLSADQQQKVQDVLAAHQPKLRQLAADQRAADQALIDQLLGTGAVTLQNSDAALQRASQAHDAMTRERVAAAIEVRSILTSDQLQKAATIRTGMKQLHAQMRELLGKDATD